MMKKNILVALATLHILPSFITVWLCVFELIATPSTMQFSGLVITAAIGFLIFMWIGPEMD